MGNRLLNPPAENPAAVSGVKIETFEGSPVAPTEVMYGHVPGNIGLKIPKSDPAGVYPPFGVRHCP